VIAFTYLFIPHSHWRMPIGFVAAAIATYLLAFPVRQLGERLKLVDIPGRRSSHTMPTPRTGGVAIILGVLIGVGCVFRPTRPFLMAAGVGGLVAGISFFDDMINIPAGARLLVHILVAGLTIGIIGLVPEGFGLPLYGGRVLLPEWLGFLLATLFVVGFVNAYNFMDGINGLAASQGVWAGVTISIMLLFAGSGNSIFTAGALGGACLGFLPHNFPRARMFMGDVGATVLGFGLSMLVLVGAARTNVSWIAFVLPLSLFIWDPLVTVLKRVVQGHNPLRPHREFHFHLLVRCGWSHDSVTRLQNVMMMAAAVCGGLYGWIPAFTGDPTLINQVRGGVLVFVVLGLATYSVLVHLYFAYNRLDSPDAEQQAPEAEVGERPGPTERDLSE
jgi:UDP-N-acetylmuramyl pentapeptide phosphotransferase/UDP-N-acetylglucosamine-1-phosphate transferase